MENNLIAEAKCIQGCEVISKDGTKIVYDKYGKGPALICITGALVYRKMPNVEEGYKKLSLYFTVYTYDRRGHGESGDTKPYSIKKEVEDIEAIIKEAGGSAYLYGHSSGAVIALEAALNLGKKVKKIALHDAPYNVDEKSQKESQEFYKKISALLEADRKVDAVEFFLSSIGMPPEMLDGMRQSPVWPEFKAMAPTILYDETIVGNLVPIEKAKQITVPALVIYGDKSPPFVATVAESLSKAIPNAKLLILKGQDHFVSPEVITPILVKFFNE